jgi:MoxR-like ATPase
VAPIAVLTSHRTRDLHDALKRRCLYHWIGYPAPTRVEEIIRRRVPEASAFLAAQVTGAVGRLRRLDLLKPPGVAEAVNWAAALRALGVAALDADVADRTLGAVLKYDDDLRTARAAGLASVLSGA